MSSLAQFSSPFFQRDRVCAALSCLRQKAGAKSFCANAPFARGSRQADLIVQKNAIMFIKTESQCRVEFALRQDHELKPGAHAGVETA